MSGLDILRELMIFTFGLTAGFGLCCLICIKKHNSPSVENPYLLTAEEIERWRRSQYL